MGLREKHEKKDALYHVRGLPDSFAIRAVEVCSSNCTNMYCKRLSDLYLFCTDSFQDEMAEFTRLIYYGLWRKATHMARRRKQ